MSSGITYCRCWPMFWPVSIVPCGGSLAQDVPCLSYHCRNLSISNGVISVQCKGHPITSSIQTGFGLYPASSAGVGSRSEPSKNFFDLILIVAVGVPSQQPRSFAVMSGSKASASSNSPFSIVPDLGKTSKYSVKPPNNEHW